MKIINNKKSLKNRDFLKELSICCDKTNSHLRRLLPPKSEEKLYAVKTVSNFYMNSSLDSPVIYPIDQGKEMILLCKENNWLNLLDSKTGLMGWSLLEDFSKEKPDTANLLFLLHL